MTSTETSTEMSTETSTEMSTKPSTEPVSGRREGPGKLASGGGEAWPRGIRSRPKKVAWRIAS
jgi:hypothetical protein